MFDGAVKDIGDGFDAAVRMPGKAGEIILRVVVAEIVEQQERIGLGGFAEAEGAAQLDAGALHGGLRLHDAFDGSDGHGSALSVFTPRAACALRRREAAGEGGELVDEVLQELAHVVVGDLALCASIRSGLN